MLPAASTATPWLTSEPLPPMSLAQARVNDPLAPGVSLATNTSLPPLFVSLTAVPALGLKLLSVLPPLHHPDTMTFPPPSTVIPPGRADELPPKLPAQTVLPAAFSFHTKASV